MISRSDDEDPPELAFFRARLDRARDRFAEFNQVWANYLDERPHRLCVDVDYETGAGVVRVERRLPIPAELSLILGEFLYQLRAALDNCLYAVAVIDSGSNPPPKAAALEWPICPDEETWTSHARRRLSGLSTELRDALHAIQPFQAEKPGWNCLRILHDLARIDDTGRCTW